MVPVGFVRVAPTGGRVDCVDYLINFYQIMSCTHGRGGGLLPRVTVRIVSVAFATDAVRGRGSGPLSAFCGLWSALTVVLILWTADHAAGNSTFVLLAKNRRCREAVRPFRCFGQR